MKPGMEWRGLGSLCLSGLGVWIVRVSAYGWCWSLWAETPIWGYTGWSPPCRARGDMPGIQGHPEEATKPWSPGPAPSTHWYLFEHIPAKCDTLPTPGYAVRPGHARSCTTIQQPQHPQSAFPGPRQPFPSTDPLHKQRRGRGRVAGMLIYSPPLFSSLHPSGKGLCRYKQTLIKSCLTGNGSSKQQARKLSKSKGSCFCCCRCCLHSQMSLIL